MEKAFRSKFGQVDFEKKAIPFMILKLKIWDINKLYNLDNNSLNPGL